MSQLGYPGIGRLAYVLLSTLIWMLAVLAFFFLLWGSPVLFFPLMTETRHVEAWMWGLLIVGNLMIWLPLAYLGILRLRNLGMSGWWLLAKCIPIFYVWLAWRMLTCPEGYADHKQLDLPGKIISAFLLLLIGLPLIIAAIDLLMKSSGSP